MVTLLMRVLGVPSWAAWLIAIAVPLAMLGGALWWHGGQVETIKALARAEQAEVDRKAVVAAEARAARAQQQLIDTMRQTQTTINDEVTRALDHARDDIARHAGDDRLRWAEARADLGRASAAEAAAISAGQPGAVDAACRARGWVAFDAASTAAQAADSYAAQVNGWIDWWTRQEAAWPKDPQD